MGLLIEIKLKLMLVFSKTSCRLSFYTKYANLNGNIEYSYVWMLDNCWLLIGIEIALSHASIYLSHRIIWISSKYSNYLTVMACFFVVVMICFSYCVLQMSLSLTFNEDTVSFLWLSLSRSAPMTIGREISKENII